jgi:NAD(P)-dependent dehydrogenase (short-subunit alcohol dehydrogenase family)
MKERVALANGADGGLGIEVTRALLDSGLTVVGLSRKIRQSDFDNSSFCQSCRRVQNLYITCQGSYL